MGKMIVKVIFERYQYQSNTVELQPNVLFFCLKLSTHKTVRSSFVFHSTTIYYGQKKLTAIHYRFRMAMFFYLQVNHTKIMPSPF